MSSIKIVSEFTDGYEVYDEVENILTKNNKHLLVYVEELTEQVISKGLFNLQKIDDEYPDEFFYGCSMYEVKETFEPLIWKNIENKNTFRAKLFLIANDYLDYIRLNGRTITELGRDIEDDKNRDIAIEQIEEQLQEIYCCENMIDDIKRILADKSLDDNKLITLRFSKNELETRTQVQAAEIYCLKGKYESYTFVCPIKLINGLKKENISNECSIEVPENMKITLYRGNDNHIEVTAVELQNYCK